MSSFFLHYTYLYQPKVMQNIAIQIRRLGKESNLTQPMDTTQYPFLTTLRLMERPLSRHLVCRVDQVGSQVLSQPNITIISKLQPFVKFFLIFFYFFFDPHTHPFLCGFQREPTLSGPLTLFKDHRGVS